jgi:hypothetical protein
VGNDAERIIGQPVRDDRPEWVRRAQSGTLVAKDMTR